MSYWLRMSGEIHDWLADLHETDVRTLVSYVEALGGRLDLTADFGGDRVILR